VGILPKCRICRHILTGELVNRSIPHISLHHVTRFEPITAAHFDQRYNKTKYERGREHQPIGMKEIDSNRCTCCVQDHEQICNMGLRRYRFYTYGLPTYRYQLLDALMILTQWGYYTLRIDLLRSQTTLLAQLRHAGILSPHHKLYRNNIFLLSFR